MRSLSGHKNIEWKQVVVEFTDPITKKIDEALVCVKTAKVDTPTGFEVLAWEIQHGNARKVVEGSSVGPTGFAFLIEQLTAQEIGHVSEDEKQLAF